MQERPSIRQVRAGAIRELELTALPGDAPFVSKPDERVWAAYAGSKPVSFIVMQTILPGTWYLARAGTLPSHRGQGLYPRLLTCAFAYGRKHGIVGCITDTARWNTASANGLIKAGFKLYDPQHRWAFEDGLYWSRTL